MPNLKRTGKLISIAALAASTTLTGPSFAFANDATPMRVAQAAPDPNAPPADAAPDTQGKREHRGGKGGGARHENSQNGAADQGGQRQHRGAAAAGQAEPPATAAPAAPAARPSRNGSSEEAAPRPGAEKPQGAARAQRSEKAEAPAPAKPEAPTPKLAPAQSRALAPKTAPAEPKAAAPAAPQKSETAPAKPAPAAPAEPKAAAPASRQAAPAPAQGEQNQAPSPRGKGLTKFGQPETRQDDRTSGDAAPAETPRARQQQGEASPTPPTPPAVAPSQALAPAATGEGGNRQSRDVAAPDNQPGENGARRGDHRRPGRSDANRGEPDQGGRNAEGRREPQPVPTELQTAPVEKGQIDNRDAKVQQLDRPVDIRSARRQKGERIKEAPQDELPPDAKVVRRVGDREILQTIGAGVAGAAVGAAAAQYFIRSDDDQRLTRNSRDRYIERLPHGETRETIVRESGVQVVTISNRYGDIVQRSRIMPDGREVVLFYDPGLEGGRGRGRDRDYRDPGADLPPIRITIPEDRYIVSLDQPNEEVYYDTIVAPPVETVDRIYSIDEVRRSKRIRDKVRRIDLNTINFQTGSAEITESEARNLDALAEAISRVIKQNPGETFLIEGHTDAVGSELDNLALSDRRADSVAAALTQYYDIPAENLITQGYGEAYLKVDTQDPNRENRRVTVRRITALVKPVAAANAQ